MVPGQPADARVQGLKRGARMILTTWVLLMVPLLGIELVTVILDGPALAGTFAVSLNAQLNAQLHDITAQFGRADVAAVLVSGISVVLLVLPVTGLGYVLLLSGWRALRSVIAVNRRHPALPSGCRPWPWPC